MPIDLTRSVLVILIPGAVAVAPWLLWLLLYTDATLGYVEKYSTVANTVSFAVAAIAGLVCETLGSWIEVRWDEEREKEYDVMTNWYAYLARTNSPEPVGHRYLSRLATMFYFELSMLFAIIPFSIGAAVLVYLRFPQHDALLASLIVVVALIVGAWFRFNAKETHRVLCLTRLKLNKLVAQSERRIAA